MKKYRQGRNHVKLEGKNSKTKRCLDLLARVWKSLQKNSQQGPHRKPWNWKHSNGNLDHAHEPAISHGFFCLWILLPPTFLRLLWSLFGSAGADADDFPFPNVASLFSRKSKSFKNAMFADSHRGWISSKMVSGLASSWWRSGTAHWVPWIQ